MCGICGIVNVTSEIPVSKEELIAMRDIMMHRGPDDADHYVEPVIGLGQRRLSILDLSEKGRQPFFSRDRKHVMVYNGEIYNFKELRKELEKQGLTFSTETDTEVLLQLYLTKGKEMLHLLNGMFAFVIWDTEAQTVFAARDRLGVKPFYYANHKGKFYFASEQKAILKAGVPKDMGENDLSEFLLFRFISGENTIFNSIKKLLPGHYLEIKNKRITTGCWWNLFEITKNNQSQINDPDEWFEKTFDSSVAYRMISDVPVGILLSGGLDSSSIAASLAHQKHKDLSSFTVSFGSKDFDESHLAKEVAHKFGFNYHDINIEEQPTDTLIEATWLLDEPLVHQNDPHILAISKMAKKHVTVLLSGEGGDETLGGYVRYKPLKQLYRYRLPISIAGKALGAVHKNRRLEKLANYFSQGNQDTLVLLNACSMYPSEFKQLGVNFDSAGFEYRRKVLSEAKALYPNHPARQAMYIDLFTYLSSLLDRNDKMTMGASIECRVPFLDYRLVEGVMTMPENQLLDGPKGKYLLYKLGQKRLPSNILNFKKWGFGVPWRDYIINNTSLREEAEGLEKNPLLEAGILKLIDKKQLKKQFFSTGQNDLLFRQLFMYHIWSKHYFQQF